LEIEFIGVAIKIELHSSLAFSACGLWKVDDITPKRSDEKKETESAG
jgi:hypothetical protein